MPLRMPTTIQFFRSEIQVAHYSSGLSLLRTSPHDATHSKGHRPEVACRNACLPLNQYPALSSSIIQIPWNIFGTKLVCCTIFVDSKVFIGFSSMLSAIKGRPKPSKTPVKSGCELALVSIQSQVIHGGLAFLRPLNHRKTNCGSLSGHSVLFCFPSHKLVLLPESDLQTESSA